jgi:hypothetical protein
MPEKKTLAKARQAKREGKSPSTQAGAFVEEQMKRVGVRKQGVKSRQQAIAIGLSEARRAGIDIPAKKTVKKATKKTSHKAATTSAARHH